METDMVVRTLYIVAGAKTAAARLVARADPAELRAFLAEGWATQPLDGLTHTGRDSAQLPADQLRQLVATTLETLLDAAAAATASRDLVDHYRLDRDDTPGVDVYLAGGPNSAEGSHAYPAWDILLDEYRLPAGWQDEINNAIGLISPHGAGPSVATVTFRTWS